MASGSKYGLFRDEHDWIENRRIPFMIVGDEVMLYEEPAPS